jgi:hypothetical protein
MSKSVVSTDMLVGEVAQSREGDKLTLNVPADLTVLYFDESDNLCSASRRIMVSCQAELQQNYSFSVSAKGGGELYAASAAGGIEVRFSVDFNIQASASYKLAWVSGARLEEAEEERKDSAERPSLILRRPGMQESLWEIAKSCRTTMQEIRCANNLEEDALPEGRLLLIPQKRLV